MVATSTSKNIAITSYKRSRNSHVGIHLWESPTSTSSSSSTTKPDSTNKKNNIMKKQIMIVHIDDHSIFATNTLSNNIESSSSSSSVPTLKVGMKLVAVNGIPVTSTTTVNEIYHKLNNAVGYITLLVSTPHLPKDMMSPLPNNSTTSNTNDTITSPPPMYTNATYVEKSNLLSQERYNLIPRLEFINDDNDSNTSSSSSSSTSSSFTSISSSNNNNNNNNTARSIVINNVNDYDDDDDEDDDELNIYELEKRIRQIWNPILMG